MLKTFKYNSLGQIAIILVTAAALWAKAFVYPVAPTAGNTFAPLYDLVYGWLFAWPRLCSAIALLLVLTEGVWLNIMLYNHKVVASNSFLPTLLYLVAMSWDYSQLTLTPMLLTNLMILMACGQLLSHGATTLDVGNNFNASFCIGIASLFYLPALWYVLPLLFVFVIYKMYRWRHIAIGLLGLAAPFLVLFTYAFLDDKLGYWLILMGFDLVNIHLNCDFSSSVATILCCCFVLLLLAALMAQAGYRDKVMIQRINSSVLTLPLLAAIPLALYGQTFPLDTQTTAIPFAFLTTSFLLTERKRKWIGETVLWVFLLCALMGVWF